MEKLIAFMMNNPKIYREVLETDLSKINQIEKIVLKYPELPIREILTQKKLRQKAIKKFSNYKDMLFTEKGLQQSSSECLSKYHGLKFSKYNSLADICCGIGSDLINLSKNKEKVYAVDLDENTLQCAKWNNKLRRNISYLEEKAEDFNKNVEAVFIDPDRRIKNKRIISPENYSPKISDIFKMLDKYPNMAIKLSPVINYHSLNIAKNHTFEFISEKGELKEILLCFGELATKGIEYKAVLLPQNVIIDNSYRDDVNFSKIDKYLFEPDPAVIRAGLVKHLCHHLGYKMIDNHLALLTSPKMKNNNYGKIYEVITSFNFNLKKLKRYIKENNIGILNIKTRGFSESVESFRKKLKLSGNNTATIFIVRMNRIHKIFITND